MVLRVVAIAAPGVSGSKTSDALKSKKAEIAKSTRIAQVGIFPIAGAYLPTTPAINATTVLANSAASFAPISAESLALGRRGVYDNFYYGGVGTPTTVALEQAIAKLEGGEFAIVTPSGQSAVVAILTALFVRGDHLLVVDTLTYSTRWYIDQLVIKNGVNVSYFDPDIGDDIEALFTSATRGVLMESPGSMTFEIMDVAAICQQAAKRGIVTILDNTWAASTFFSPFNFGVDISVASLGKSHFGPSAISAGCVVTRCDKLHQVIRNQAALLGLWVSPDAVALGMVSLPTLHLRLQRQQATAAQILTFLTETEGVAMVFHPSMPETLGHLRWSRDFTGANSLISIGFDGWPETKVHAFVDALRIIRLGYGWGGALSLVSIFEADVWRSVSRSPARGTCLRIFIGLEDAQDLIEDLRQAFARVNARFGRA